MSGNVPEVYYGGTQAQWDAITIEEGNEYLTNGTLHTETYAVSGGGWYLDLSNGAMTANGTISSNEGVFAWDPWRDKITSLEFNEHTYWFESGCFKDCVNLKTIRFNSEHLAIFGDAFAGCTGLTDIYYNESESKWKEEGNDKAFPDSPKMTVHYKAQPVSGSCGDNAKWTYDEASGVLVISGQGALYGRDNRTWEHWSSYVRVIIVEEGITDLGDQAFYGCTKLVRLVLPEGVTTIGQYAFHATSLNDITLPVSLKSVHAGVLMSGGPNTDIHYKGTEAQWNAIEFGENNDGFTRANIHFNTTCDHDMVIEYAKTPTCLEEGNTMGKHCTVCNQVFVEKRQLPKAAHTFEFDHSGNSFYKCFKCGTVLDESVPTYGEFGNGLTWNYSFKNSNMIVSYNELTIRGQGEMPDFTDPSETPWSMFTTDIERVVLTDGVDSVGNRAFEGCANLKNVLFSDVVSIGDHAFDGCVNLNNMTIESPVKNIGDSAFRGCDGLVEVVYYGSEKEWKNVEVGSGNEDLLNAGFIFANPVDYVPNPFTDVAKSDWFANPVLWAFDTGVTGGTSADTFGPNNFCTRAQVVTFLYAAAGKPEVNAAYSPFVDVKPTDWFYAPVMWAVQQGITSGTDDTHFSPEASCTRAQVVTFLYAAQGKPEVTGYSKFYDVGPADWYYAPVLWAAQNS
ncbi:MAG: leucine-rich repeat protein, partial [Oscillospiraceae bacterium]|nr:leucine-rich repeat protein [Oscillospiraceae bacterium]